MGLRYLIGFTILFFLQTNVKGQKKVDRFLNASAFEWRVDPITPQLTLYYEADSYAEEHIETLKATIPKFIRGTLQFIGIDAYYKPIHYFILESRHQMKALVGYETNGLSNARNDLVIAIYSEKLNSVFSRHELFHLMAMNTWGVPETWINEGMAVASDDQWLGYDLHELSKYLIDTGKYIPLGQIARRLKSYDSMITYPLLGSFSKFVDTTYGRETLLLIWKNGRRKLEKQLERSLEALEKEWLEHLKSISYEDIDYIK